MSLQIVFVDPGQPGVFVRVVPSHDLVSAWDRFKEGNPAMDLPWKHYPVTVRRCYVIFAYIVLEIVPY